MFPRNRTYRHIINTSTSNSVTQTTPQRRPLSWWWWYRCYATSAPSSTYSPSSSLSSRPKTPSYCRRIFAFSSRLPLLLHRTSAVSVPNLSTFSPFSPSSSSDRSRSRSQIKKHKDKYTHKHEHELSPEIMWLQLQPPSANGELARQRQC